MSTDGETGGTTADPLAAEGVAPDGVAGEGVVDQPRSLLRASAAPAVGTALSRASGLLRVSALTAALGLTQVADTYNLANTTPNILYELVLGGVLSSTLVPMFIHTSSAEGGRKLRRPVLEVGEEGDDPVSVIVTVGFVAITALTVLAVLASPLINQLFALPLEGAEREQQLRLGDDLLALLLPQILFYGVTTLATALLHARRHFAAPAFAPVLTNLVTTVAGLAVWWLVSNGHTGDDSTLTVYLLGLGTTAGVASMAAALLPSIRRAGIDLRWRFQPRHPAVRKVLRLSGWTVGFAAANQVALLVILTLARGSGEGAVSAYQYAFIFFQLPYGLIAVSIMTAILPDLSEAARAHDVIAFREKFIEGLAVLLTFLLPAAGAYLFLGEPLVELLLQRGSFTAEDTRLTARMLAGFSIGLPFFATFLYCVRAFHARRNTRTPFWLNLFENTLNVALVVPFVALFDEPGLSLAYSAAYVVAAIGAVLVLNRHVHRTLTLRGLAVFGRGVLVSLLVVAASATVTLWLRHVVGVGPLLQILVTLAVAVPVFAAGTWVLRPHGFDDTIQTLVAGLRRRSGRSGS
ncbi:MAG: murein biosynthesis integral membrane protein MurJ [Microthrixaceae bacterium]|nr:murein biosynthesis integral membrane protein MurJ [Microthrixaceae bacterium]